MPNHTSARRLALRASACLLLASLFTQGCASRPTAFTFDPDLQKPWALAGYLPENPGQRVWVTMKADRIAEVSPVRPALPPGQTLETNSTIFPGFIDLNAQLSHAGLEISNLPRAQFRNRAEWYYKQSLYYGEQSRLPGEAGPRQACASTRWGELRALSGGAALVRGQSGEALPCADNFGVSNAESTSDSSEGKIYSEERAVIPSYMEKIFVPLLLPAMEKGASYEQAFRLMLDEKKISLWVTNFRGDTHNIANALKLLIGKDFGVRPEAMQLSDFKSIAPRLEQFFLTGTYAMSPAAARIQVSQLEAWIFGDAKEVGFLKANREEGTAFAFLARPGVLLFDPTLRAYIGSFEPKIRAPIAAALSSTDTRAVFLNLGEGVRGDPYAQEEFALARRLGYFKPGLVVVGGSAYRDSEFSDLGSSGVSIVWSPFSDLLLYGDSLDVNRAKAAGVNLTLGTGNATAGTKNLLDQLKIARNYLDAANAREITNRELIEMVTLNAARALRMEGQLGVVKAGAFAHLTLLQCSVAKNPYDCAVGSQSGDVSLVVSAGVPRYGSPEILGALAPAEGREILPFARSEGDCAFRKALLVDPRREEPLGSAALIRTALSAPPGPYAAGAPHPPKLAPLFSCQDANYEGRWKDFIAEVLPGLRLKRAKVRREEKLDETWNPLARHKRR